MLQLNENQAGVRVSGEADGLLALVGAEGTTELTLKPRYPVQRPPDSRSGVTYRDSLLVL
jgi:hypothetical protein